MQPCNGNCCKLCQLFYAHCAQQLLLTHIGAAFWRFIMRAASSHSALSLRPSAAQPRIVCPPLPLLTPTSFFPSHLPYRGLCQATSAAVLTALPSLLARSTFRFTLLLASLPALALLLSASLLLLCMPSALRHNLTMNRTLTLAIFAAVCRLLRPVVGVVVDPRSLHLPLSFLHAERKQTTLWHHNYYKQRRLPLPLPLPLLLHPKKRKRNLSHAACGRSSESR